MHVATLLHSHTFVRIAFRECNTMCCIRGEMHSECIHASHTRAYKCITMCCIRVHPTHALFKGILQHSRRDAFTDRCIHMYSRRDAFGPDAFTCIHAMTHSRTDAFYSIHVVTHSNAFVRLAFKCIQMYSIYVAFVH